MRLHGRQASLEGGTRQPILLESYFWEYTRHRITHESQASIMGFLQCGAAAPLTAITHSSQLFRLLGRSFGLESVDSLFRDGQFDTKIDVGQSGKSYSQPYHNNQRSKVNEPRPSSLALPLSPELPHRTAVIVVVASVLPKSRLDIVALKSSSTPEYHFGGIVVVIWLGSAKPRYHYKLMSLGQRATPHQRGLVNDQKPTGFARTRAPRPTSIFVTSGEWSLISSSPTTSRWLLIEIHLSQD
ncbi:hypothetical protein PanWU01x14_293420 [Parasponia andersonii]|uniref:Uncharacterized protein n=1 Tax=Parasponia andersonii TaxID=3476 RepID=A0A2P5AWL5_PARAD|nr:hypothetical protein PanWU01x14_293420 [Parasponia andersonii]